MTDKEAINILANCIDDYVIGDYCIGKHCIDENMCKDKDCPFHKAIQIVLNLIQTQQEEIERLKQTELKAKGGAIKVTLEGLLEIDKKMINLETEIENKNKRISDLEFALMDMVLQFADENEDSINTMGLSALEIAFNELNFDNPMSIKEVHERYKKLAQKYYE